MTNALPGFDVALAAHAMLSADEDTEANERAMDRWAEQVKAEDEAWLDQGFGLFSQAEAAKRKAAFMFETYAGDLYRVLLSDYWEDEYKEGRSGPPESPFWQDMLFVGGWDIFKRFRTEFRRAWNTAVTELGLDELKKPPAEPTY